MKKRLVFAVISLLMVSQLALATVPSPTADDLYVVTVTLPDGSPAPDGLVIALEPETELVAQVVADIVQQAQGLPVTSTYFATYQEAIQGVLPEGADLAALELQELTGLVVSGYEEAMGDVAVRFGFPTLFDPLKPVVVLVGLAEGDGVTWQVLEFAVSNADGGVDTIFPAELLLAVQAGQALIAVLQ